MASKRNLRIKTCENDLDQEREKTEENANLRRSVRASKNVTPNADNNETKLGENGNKLNLLPSELTAIFCNRGAGKRQPKLMTEVVLPSMIRMSGGDGEEEDEDFHVQEEELEVESESNNDGDNNNDVQDATDSDESSSDDDKNPNNEVDSAQSSDDDLTLDQTLDKFGKQRCLDNVINAIGSSSVHQPLICAVCLLTEGELEDYIVQCDKCGISVHECCYGEYPDLDSTSDTQSESSDGSETEPWFCATCLAGLSEPPDCELCPTIGGIYKRTDDNNWIHVVCGLYVHQVSYGEVERVENACLQTVPYQLWGAKTCAFCEDPRFARAGIAVQCDAGRLCKTYFHPSCGQKMGFLAEPEAAEDPDSKKDIMTDEVQPTAFNYFSFCKTHSDPEVVKSRQRSFKLLQKQISNFTCCMTGKVEKCFNRQSVKYIENRKNVQPWFPETPVQRPASTRPSLAKLLTKRAEKLGQIHKGVPVEFTVNVTNKWYIPPAFDVNFVAYFQDRERRFEEIETSIVSNVKKNKELKEDLFDLEKKLRRVTYVVDNMQLVVDTRVNQMISTTQSLKGITNLEYTLPITCTSTLGLLSRQITAKKSSSKVTDGGIKGQPDTEKDETRKPGVVKDDGKDSEDVLIVLHKCEVCKLRNNQHLVIECDSCKLHFHINCLDPPLSRVPKKGEKWLWQCKLCCPDTTKVQVFEDKLPRRRKKTTIFGKEDEESEASKEKRQQSDNKENESSSAVNSAESADHLNTPVQGGSANVSVNSVTGSSADVYEFQDSDSEEKSVRNPQPPQAKQFPLNHNQVLQDPRKLKPVDEAGEDEKFVMEPRKCTNCRQEFFNPEVFQSHRCLPLEDPMSTKTGAVERTVMPDENPDRSSSTSDSSSSSSTSCGSFETVPNLPDEDMIRRVKASEMIGDQSDQLSRPPINVTIEEPTIDECSVKSKSGISDETVEFVQADKRDEIDSSLANHRSDLMANVNTDQSSDIKGFSNIRNQLECRMPTADESLETLPKSSPLDLIDKWANESQTEQSFDLNDEEPQINSVTDQTNLTVSGCCKETNRFQSDIKTTEVNQETHLINGERRKNSSIDAAQVEQKPCNEEPVQYREITKISPDGEAIIVKIAIKPKKNLEQAVVTAEKQVGATDAREQQINQKRSPDKYEESKQISNVRLMSASKKRKGEVIDNRLEAVKIPLYSHVEKHKLNDGKALGHSSKHPENEADGSSSLSVVNVHKNAMSVKARSPYLEERERKRKKKSKREHERGQTSSEVPKDSTDSVGKRDEVNGGCRREKEIYEATLSKLPKLIPMATEGFVPPYSAPKESPSHPAPAQLNQRGSNSSLEKTTKVTDPNELKLMNSSKEKTNRESLKLDTSRDALSKVSKVPQPQIESNQFLESEKGAKTDKVPPNVAPELETSAKTSNNDVQIKTTAPPFPPRNCSNDPSVNTHKDSKHSNPVKVQNTSKPVKAKVKLLDDLFGGPEITSSNSNSQISKTLSGKAVPERKDKPVADGEKVIKKVESSISYTPRHKVETNERPVENNVDSSEKNLHSKRPSVQHFKIPKAKKPALDTSSINARSMNLEIAKEYGAESFVKDKDKQPSKNSERHPEGKPPSRRIFGEREKPKPQPKQFPPAREFMKPKNPLDFTSSKPTTPVANFDDALSSPTFPSAPMKINVPGSDDSLQQKIGQLMEISGSEGTSVPSATLIDDDEEYDPTSNYKVAKVSQPYPAPKHPVPPLRAPILPVPLPPPTGYTYEDFSYDKPPTPPPGLFNAGDATILPSSASSAVMDIKDPRNPAYRTAPLSKLRRDSDPPFNSRDAVRIRDPNMQYRDSTASRSPHNQSVAPVTHQKPPNNAIPPPIVMVPPGRAAREGVKLSQKPPDFGIFPNDSVLDSAPTHSTPQYKKKKDFKEYLQENRAKVSHPPPVVNIGRARQSSGPSVHAENKAPSPIEEVFSVETTLAEPEVPNIPISPSGNIQDCSNLNSSVSDFPDESRPGTPLMDESADPLIIRSTDPNDPVSGIDPSTVPLSPNATMRLMKVLIDQNFY